MEVCSLVLIFSRIDAACAESGLSDKKTRAESGTSDILCDSCFKEANNKFSGIAASSDGNFQVLYKYLKMLNDNYKCYELAEKSCYEEAIEVLLESDQKTLLSTIYDLKFAKRNEMLQFNECFSAYYAAIDHHCEAPIRQAFFLYREAIGQIFMGYGNARAQNARANAKGKHAYAKRKRAYAKKKHAYYYDKYLGFINRDYNSEELMDCLTTIITKIKTNTKNKHGSSVSYHFYDAFLSKMSKLNSLTDEIVLRALSSFIYRENGNRLSVGIVSFQPVYAFIGYQARSWQYKAEIANLVKAILLDKRHLAAESIYSLLRVYKVCRGLAFPIFTDYTILVHNIISGHGTIGNDEERRVFANLHCSLVRQLLPLYYQEPLSWETLRCFEKLGANIAVLSDEIDKVGQPYIRKMCENAGTAVNIVMLLQDFWKAGDLPVMADLFSRILLTSEQALNLLKAISAQKLVISTKVSILSMLVKCDVLNAASRSCISTSLGIDDPDLIVAYSLALISYICRTKRAGKTVDDGILNAYFELCANYPLIFTYSYMHHSGEYYVLHAYDILFNQYYSDNEEFRTLWMFCALPDYQLSFFTTLWSKLSGISNAPNPASADYDELVEVKIWAFKALKSYSQINKENDLLGKLVHDLLGSKLALSDIYIYYFQSDLQYANYLIARYFFYRSEIRGRNSRIKIDNKHTTMRREKFIECLKDRAVFILYMTTSGAPSSLYNLGLAISRTSEAVYKLGIIDAMRKDEELCRLAETMVLGILDVLFDSANIENGTTSRELRVMQILNLILN